MSFRIVGVDPQPFRHLFGLSNAALREQNVARYVADRTSAFPDRIELRDVDPGEAVLLVNFVHQPAATPYRASHAIFIREGADAPCAVSDAVPASLRARPLSLRAFDARHMMLDGELVDGALAEALIERMLADPDVAYLHAHFARRGCYAARIERFEAELSA